MECSFASVKNWFKYQRRLNLQKLKSKKANNLEETSFIPASLNENEIPIKKETKKENEGTIRKEIKKEEFLYQETAYMNMIPNMQTLNYFSYLNQSFLPNHIPFQGYFYRNFVNCMFGLFAGRQIPPQFSNGFEEVNRNVNYS